MSNKIKERLFGVIVTMISSVIMFLSFNLFNSFETKAGSESKFGKLDKKIDIVLCYLDKKHCLK